MKQNYKNISFDFINCKNIVEKGPFIIQECTDIQDLDSYFYTLWDKNKREHLKENDIPIIFSSKEQALSFVSQYNIFNNPEAEIER